MCAGTVPFKHPSIMGLYNVIRTQPISFPNKPVVSASLKDLISQMLCKDPAKRATLPQVMTHPWTTHGNNLPLQCRQVSVGVTPLHLFSFHFIPYSLGCGASNDSSDILA